MDSMPSKSTAAPTYSKRRGCLRRSVRLWDKTSHFASGWSLLMSHVAGSLRALLANLIDYAGLYPPAALPLAEVTENYRRYRESPDSWMLNRLVLPFAKLDGLELTQHCRISLLVDDEPGPLPRQVETFEIKSARKLSLPTYCEVPLQQVIG